MLDTRESEIGLDKSGEDIAMLGYLFGLGLHEVLIIIIVTAVVVYLITRRRKR